MTRESPGFFKRIFSWVGGLVRAIRWIINVLFLIIVGVFLFSFFGQEVKPLPEKAALRLMPSGMLVEERSYADPITQLMEQSSPYDAETPVRDLTKALKHAKTDPRITGLVLDLSHLAGGGISKLDEVGRAIDDFRASGKPVIAISDNYSQEQYYLASHADEIQVNPMGGVVLTGFGYYGSFFKEAADKLKINFHVFRTGEFKSAVEPFTRSDMSPEARQNTLAWIDELWNAYTTDVENQRKLPQGTIDNFVDNLHINLRSHGGDMASLALEAKLVDRIASRPQMTASLADRFGADKDGFINIFHKDYLNHLRLPSLDKAPKENTANIGVIVASGTILDGEQMEGAIGGDTLSQLLRQARQDSSLKALVLRVDSPGGSAFASDLIRQELIQVQKTMPVIVSMGSMAASGGYWIAAQADEIWAQPTTLTGSIGVFGIIPTFEDSLAALGVNSDGVGTTSLADFNHLDRPLSPEVATIIQLSVDNIYHQFVRLVADGRQRTPAEIDEIARGRVWTGQQALEKGLVDKMGDLDDAVAAAAKKAGVENWQVKYVTRPLSFQEQLMKQLAEGSAQLLSPLTAAPLAQPLTQKVANYLQGLDTLGALNDPQNIYLQCFGCPSL
ncbi:MAG: signal peptide peptidase SppA [Porticoccaceae bacterium]|nr:signal peptide peptidase SppA [Porticoccaceae bacterium]